MENAPALLEFLQKPRKAVIITHPKPDADALGSSLGLYLYLKKKGHTATVITPTDYPEFLTWMPGNETVFVFKKGKEAQAAALIADAEVVFCLDFSNLSRIPFLGEHVAQSRARKVLIDHHLEPEGFAQDVFWDSKAASTTELVLGLIQAWGDQASICPDIANCLYAGLMTDTGGFRHGHTNEKAFLTAATLVSRGANPSKVSKLIYDNNSLERLRLTGYVLHKKLQVLPEYRTALVSLNFDDFKEFSSQTGDTEGLVNYGLSIKDVRLSILIYERREDIKLSFRSLGDFSVNELARSHFEGGGHKNAAGGQSKVSLAETEKKIMALLPQYQEKLLTSE